ncbi:MAG: hypothetical protein ACR2OU_10535 [Thermomicrobiales bacterium]
MATLTDDSWVVGAIDVPKLLGDDPDGWQSLVGLMICRENLVLCRIGHVQPRRGLPFLITVSGCDGEFRTNSEYLNAFAYLVFPDPDRAHHLLRASLYTIAGRANQEAARQRKESQDRIVALINRRIEESSIRQVSRYWIKPTDSNLGDWRLARILTDLDFDHDLILLDVEYLKINEYFGALAAYYRNIASFDKESWSISQACSALRGPWDPKLKVAADLHSAIILTSKWIESPSAKKAIPPAASAVWTTRGAALLDLGKKVESKESADNALALAESHYPHNLLRRYHFKFEDFEAGAFHFGRAKELEDALKRDRAKKVSNTRSAIESVLKWEVTPIQRSSARAALERHGIILGNFVYGDKVESNDLPF